MKKILLILSFASLLLSCKGEDLSQNPNDPYKEIETLEREKEKERPQVPQTYQEIRVPNKLKYYYQSINFSQRGEALKEDLAILTISKHTHILDYLQRHPYLKKADADQNNPENVIVVYTGESREKSHINRSVNTEHIYPQSYLKKYSNPERPIGDLHHLRYCDSNINSQRSNLPFGKGEKEAKIVSNGKAWYPSDAYRGDVARMIMYMYLRYNLPWNHVSNQGVSLFLMWNAQDPVSPLELQRNNEIETAQGNRNPFIDNPYLATLIFGEVTGYTPENTWK